MSTVTKKDLVLTVSERLGANAAEVHDIAQMLFDEMNRQLGLGNRIELRDFGVFSFKKRAARIGHNPRTLEKVEVKEKVVVSFKMGKKMRENVNKLVEEEAPESRAQEATPPGAAVEQSEPAAASPATPPLAEAPATPPPPAADSAPASAPEPPAEGSGPGTVPGQ